MAWLFFILFACYLGWTSGTASVVVYTQDPPHSIIDEFIAEPAVFGPRFPEEGVRGLLTLADPPDGCSVLTPPPENDHGDKWIVLLARYNCTFDVKIRNAQAAGFDCAIVHNVNSSELESMTSKNSEGIEIPSVFVNDVTGFKLADDYLYNDGCFVVVKGEWRPYVRKYFNTREQLLWIVVGVLSVFILIGIVIIKCIRDKRSQRLHEKRAPCVEKLPSEDTLKGPYRSKEEEANSCISAAVV